MAVEPALTKEELARRRQDSAQMLKDLVAWLLIVAVCAGTIVGVVELINRGYIRL